MKVQLCAFSGFKLYPGRGIRFVRADAKSFVFYSDKCKGRFLIKKNPREIAWTVLYRQIHRKKSTEAVKQKRVRRNFKTEKGITGLSLEEIRQRRNQKPEVRKAAREEAIREVKEKRKAAAATKADKKAASKPATKAKPAKAAEKTAKAAPQQKAARTAQKGR
eukprot:m51a1_g14860 putative 60S ribosomal protein L24e (163) ;mRNA; f:554246-555030